MALLHVLSRIYLAYSCFVSIFTKSSSLSFRCFALVTTWSNVVSSSLFSSSPRILDFGAPDEGIARGRKICYFLRIFLIPMKLLYLDIPKYIHTWSINWWHNGTIYPINTSQIAQGVPSRFPPGILFKISRGAPFEEISSEIPSTGTSGIWFLKEYFFKFLMEFFLGFVLGFFLSGNYENSSKVSYVIVASSCVYSLLSILLNQLRERKSKLRTFLLWFKTRDPKYNLQFI